MSSERIRTAVKQKVFNFKDKENSLSSKRTGIALRGRGVRKDFLMFSIDLRTNIVCGMTGK